MSRNRKYTTDYQISNYLGTDVDDEEVRQYILATQSFIENKTARVFKADTEATPRLYDGSGRQHLIIDDCIEVTKVEVGNDRWGDSMTEVTASGTDRYYTLPTNNGSDSDFNEPIRKIGLRARTFTEGHANHQITAKWGYSENVPEDISYAATVIASGMYYQNKGENSGAIKSQKIGEYSVTYADGGGLNDFQQAMQILNSHTKIIL